MRYKPYTEIESIDPHFMEQVVQETGIDNFVESADGDLQGLPNVDTDPTAKRLADGMQAQAMKLGHTATNGNGGEKHRRGWRRH